MKKTVYIQIVMLLIVPFSLFAQQAKLKNTELVINAFYGVSGWKGSLAGGTLTPDFGPQFSVEGSYFLGKCIGIGSGVGYADYATTVKADAYSMSMPFTDEDGDKLLYVVKANGLSEKDKLSALEVPLFVAFRQPSSNLYFEAKAGVKVSIPISSSYKLNKGTITTTGVYDAYGVELTDLPDHGFQTATDLESSGKLTTKTSLSLFAKAGVVVPVSKVKLHISLYGAYGLSSALKEGDAVFVSYPNVYHSLGSLSTKTALVNGGLQLGLEF
jgi:hypothetical protein